MTTKFETGYAGQVNVEKKQVDRQSAQCAKRLLRAAVDAAAVKVLFAIDELAHRVAHAYVVLDDGNGAGDDHVRAKYHARRAARIA